MFGFRCWQVWIDASALCRVYDSFPTTFDSRSKSKWEFFAIVGLRGYSNSLSTSDCFLRGSCEETKEEDEFGECSECDALPYTDRPLPVKLKLLRRALFSFMLSPPIARNKRGGRTATDERNKTEERLMNQSIDRTN